MAHVRTRNSYDVLEKMERLEQELNETKEKLKKSEKEKAELRQRIEENVQHSNKIFGMFVSLCISFCFAHYLFVFSPSAVCVVCFAQPEIY